MSAWTVIAHTEVGSGGASSIEFSSIPSTYTDLVLFVADRSNRSATNDAVIMKLNNTTSTGRRLYGSGSTVTSTANPDPLDVANTATSNTFSNISFYIPNYSNTTTNKPWFADGTQENNATSAYQSITAGLYASTSAVSTITLTVETGTGFVQYSSATLYGITKGSSGGVTVS
jgi:hypothetical protein